MYLKFFAKLALVALIDLTWPALAIAKGKYLAKVDDLRIVIPPVRFGKIMVFMDAGGHYTIVGANNLSLTVNYDPGSHDSPPTEQQLFGGLYLETKNGKRIRVAAGSKAEETILKMLKDAAANTYGYGSDTDKHSDVKRFRHEEHEVSYVIWRIEERRTLVEWGRHPHDEDNHLTIDPTRLEPPLEVQNVVTALTGPNYLVVSGGNQTKIKVINVEPNGNPDICEKWGKGGAYLMKSAGGLVRLVPGRVKTAQVVEALKKAIMNSYGSSGGVPESYSVKTINQNQASNLLSKLVEAETNLRTSGASASESRELDHRPSPKISLRSQSNHRDQLSPWSTRIRAAGPSVGLPRLNSNGSPLW